MNTSIRIFFLIFLLFFIEKECFSQNVPLAKATNQSETENQKIPLKAMGMNYRGVIIQISYSYWYHNSLSLNILHGNYSDDYPYCGVAGVGANVALVGKDIIISPQIVGEVNILFYTLRGTLMYMTDFKQRGDIMFKPEFGIGVDATSITLGFNLVLDEQYDRTPSYFSIGLQVGIKPKGKFFRKGTPATK